MAKKNIIVVYTFLLILFFDQMTKFLIKKNFQLGQSVPVIKDTFHITYVTNTGSAFGLFRGFNVFLIFFSVIVIFIIFYFLWKIKNNDRLLQLALGLLLGGTLGNLIDRLFYGSVTDFIDFRIWPVFNVADSAVSVSVFLLIILMWEK